MLSEDELRGRARRAYELGRLRRSLFAAWPVIPLAGLSLLSCGPMRPTLLAVVALAGVVVACAHRGGAWARGIAPGLWAGLVPLSASLAAPKIAMALGDSCDAACRLLSGICLVGGVAAGGLLACGGRRSTASLIGAAAIAGLTGTLGCAVLGAGSLVGLAAGLATGLAPGLVRRA